MQTPEPTNQTDSDGFIPVKPKRGRPLKHSIKDTYVIDDEGNFNLRAFLRVAIKLSDLDEHGKLSHELMLSMYNNAVTAGYKNEYKQFSCTCRFVLSQKRRQLEELTARSPVSV